MEATTDCGIEGKTHEDCPKGQRKNLVEMRRKNLHIQKLLKNTLDRKWRNARYSGRASFLPSPERRSGVPPTIRSRTQSARSTGVCTN